MSVVFGLTAFAGAALLFAVEPMAAKALLPLLGGTASVWSACLAFFQSALLLGYFYAHVTSRLSPRVQALAHAMFLVVCVGMRPSVVVAATDHPPTSADPTLWLLGRLGSTLGLPFVALAATSSLLQRWYAASRPPGRADPYPLYAASNLGSLLALLAYPLALEPWLPLAEQARAWRWAFAGFSILMVVCAAATARSSVGAIAHEATPVARRTWALWMALAFIPSSLMQGVTTYLTTDIAAIPLLWVVPLGLYLLSFVLTFASRPPLPHPLMIRCVPIVALALLPPLAAGLVQWFWMPVHLLFFFVAAMACHGELARLRPPPAALTGFYLAIAIGGVVGSLFNAVVAPLIFDRMAEYPIAIVLACLVPALRPGQKERLRSSLALSAVILGLTALLSADPGGFSATGLGAMSVSAASGLFLYVIWTLHRRPIAFALSVGAILLGTGLSPGIGGRILLRERNFYGILRVTEDDKAHARRLFHGWTLHGQQSTEPGREREPTTYYLPGGPASQVVGTMDGRPRARVAVVGLGIGGLAPYAKPGQGWTFYELDPAVEAVARDPSLFTYLRDSPAAPIDVILGDARLSLHRDSAADRAYDLIVLDAFSSDAIPVHLLTREALALYLAKRAPSGLIAYHISTRHLDLEPILGALAAEYGMVARIRRDLKTPEEQRAGEQPTVWVVLADRAADLGPIAADPRWTPARIARAAWTDDRSSLLDVLAIGRGARGGR